MKYRERLPQLSGETFLTDGGMETTLIFHRGLDLPHFAAIALLEDESGTKALREYFVPYLELARSRDVGILLDTPTWRGSRDWGERLGYDPKQLVDLNKRAAELVDGLRRDFDDESTPVVVAGCVGPRGDGYAPDELMTADEAERYHTEQIETFAEAPADLIGALTMTYADEAVGIVRAAEAAGMPVAVSFTVETDGRLPSGTPLRDAIEHVDDETGGAAAYFMVNCAHPTHFAHVLGDGGSWLDRIRGIRANASPKSHAELDEATELDEGDPNELAEQYVMLRELLSSANVVGGCCGTDERHVGAICDAWLSER